MIRIYLALGAIVIIGLGTYLVSTRTPLAAPSDTGGTWGGAGSINIFSGTPLQPTEPRRPTTEEVLKGQAASDTLPFIPTIAIQNPEEAEGFDLDALLAQLTGETSGGAPASSGGPDFSSIYSFIPKGFISTNATIEERTPAQQELFEYGNNIGSYLRGFEDSHANMLTTLKNAHEDRGNQAKAEAAARIARDYIALGESLRELSSVPAVAQSAHMAVAEAHIAVGTKLLDVVYATEDETFLNAIDAYNSSVEVFSEKFVSLALLFQSAGVQFNTHDAGSVFTFSPTLSF
jgi:hypothetical protein